MGSGISAKYELCTYEDSLQENESYERHYDDDYVESFCREKIETPPVKGSSLDENYLMVKDKYPLRAGGNLGEKGKTSGINVYKSDNPMQSAMEMYSDLSYGEERSLQKTIMESKLSLKMRVLFCIGHILVPLKVLLLKYPWLIPSILETKKYTLY